MTISEPDIGLLLTTPPPQICDKEARAIARDTFGLDGDLRRLSSERDANFLLRTEKGEGYVLKFTNEMEPEEQTDFQTKALLHLERTASGLTIPRVIPTLSGAYWLPLANGSRVRMLSYVEGDLSSMMARSPQLAQAVAVAGAQLVNALAGFEHPGADHYLIWDIKNAASLRSMLDLIDNAGQRAQVEQVIDLFDDKVAPQLASLPWQVIHGDMNPQNLVTGCGPDIKIGVLDFGDMVRSPRICELAIAAGYQLDFADIHQSLGDFLATWHRISPLTQQEVELAASLIATRFATIITVASWRAKRYPENQSYITRNLALASDGIRHLAGLDTRGLFRSLPELQKEI